MEPKTSKGRRGQTRKPPEDSRQLSLPEACDESRPTKTDPPTTAAPPPEESKHPAFQRALEVLRREDRTETATVPELPQLRADAPAPPALEPPLQPAAVVEGRLLADSPDAIPARMLNEFVYCPRLFYYEFVEGVFLANADTLRGGAIHQRVDAGKGDLPPAAKAEAGKNRSVSPKAEAAKAAAEVSPAEMEVIHSRSVQLGSDRLGVVAKLDLIEVCGTNPEGGSRAGFIASSVVPVDYKAGSPREGAEENELWPTDRMQLGLQMLLLRDNGYTCTEGVIYYGRPASGCACQ